MAKVRWIEVRGKRQTLKAGPCFQPMERWRTKPKQVIYLGYVNDLLKPEDAWKYAEWLKKFFPDGTFEFKAVKVDKVEGKESGYEYYDENPTPPPAGSYMHFTIEGMAYKKMKIWLTAFRYIHEYPNRVAKFLKAVGNETDTEKAFAIMQRAFACEAEGHNLIATVYGNYGDEKGNWKNPITLAQFHLNLKDPKKTRVFSHFVYP